MSSALTWLAVDYYFNFLERIKFPQIFRWNSKTQEFSVREPTTKCTILWVLSYGSTFLNYMVLPPYILLIQLFSKNPTVSLVQIIFLVLLFFAALHSLPCICKALTDGKDLTRAINHLIQLQRIIKGKLGQRKLLNRKLTQTFNLLRLMVPLDSYVLLSCSVLKDS